MFGILQGESMFNFFQYRCIVEDGILCSLAIADCFNFGLIDLIPMNFVILSILYCLIIKSALRLAVFWNSDYKRYIHLVIK